MNAQDRIAAGPGGGQPCGVDPHLLKENICAVFLVPVQNAIENAHLRAVKGEVIAFGLVDALLDLHAIPVESQPTGVPINLLPGMLILRRRVGTPAAAAVADWDGLLYRVPRGSDAATHGVDDLACVYTD